VRVRAQLILQILAVAAASAALLLLVGLPLLARRSLGMEAFILLVAVDALVVVGAGWLLLGRAVARPVERLLEAAARLGEGGRGLPPLGPPGDADQGLERAAVAFERTGAELRGERARLAEKVSELQASNQALTGAREGMLRTERLATVGQLAAGVAHEVGNPLGAITGYAELARSKHGDRGGPLDDYLSRIATEAARIDAIVRGLLDFARPSGFELAPVALGPALEAAARLARMQGRCREVAVALALAPDLPAVLADERRLVQVLLNLLLNAGDAMGGRGAVRVTGALEGAAPGQVVVTVDDAGPGIPADHLPRVFDPFFTTKQPGEGTGLGLAVCHGIMESFGGSIEADAAPGGGARLRLRLRAAPPVEGRS